MDNLIQLTIAREGDAVAALEVVAGQPKTEVIIQQEADDFLTEVSADLKIFQDGINQLVTISPSRWNDWIAQYGEDHAKSNDLLP